MSQTTEARQSADTATADASMTHPDWCDESHWCWAYTAEEDKPEEGREPAPGGYHESAWVEIPTSNNNRVHVIGLQAKLDHGQPDTGVEVTLTTGKGKKDPVLFLSQEQATQLRDALDHFLGQDALTTAFRLGSDIYRRKYIRAMADTVKAYCDGYVDALDKREPVFGPVRRTEEA